jgi:hypothetical protein
MGLKTGLRLSESSNIRVLVKISTEALSLLVLSEATNQSDLSQHMKWSDVSIVNREARPG